MYESIPSLSPSLKKPWASNGINSPSPRGSHLPSAIDAALVCHETEEQRLHDAQADAVDGAEAGHPHKVLHAVQGDRGTVDERRI